MLRSQQRVSKTEAVAEGGMVTAMHSLAAEAGIELLRGGGNAADAAIAAALAAGVVEPFMSGLGGCAYAVAFDAKRGSSLCVDGSALVPGEAREDMFELAPAGVPRLGLYGWPPTRDDAAETGYRSIAVPGALAALAKLHETLGSKPWEELFSPAIRLAEDGFAADDYLFVQSAAAESRLRRFPETMTVFFRADGTAKAPDVQGTERLQQPDLARTLRTLAAEGPDVFYLGRFAEAIVQHVREAGGALSLDDLASYRARVADPLVTSYRGRRIELLPGASGGPTVALALAILEGFDLETLARDGAERLHVLAEAMRLSFLDRFRFLGDPERVPVPLQGLLSKRYAEERREWISTERRRTEMPPGDPWKYEPERTAPPIRGSADAAAQHTTHLNVVDRDRNMVSLTATLGARFGSGVTVPGLGVVLNNGMMWFDPEPGRLNSITPGKRALHAAAPALVFDGDHPLAAVGSPGARKIMTAVLQVLLHQIDHHLGMQQAIEAPRIHWEGDASLLVDAQLPPSVIEALERRGHPVSRQQESFFSSHFGRPSGILVDHGDGCLRGGVEPYRASMAVGY